MAAAAGRGLRLCERGQTSPAAFIRLNERTYYRRQRVAVAEAVPGGRKQPSRAGSSSKMPPISHSTLWTTFNGVCYKKAREGTEGTEGALWTPGRNMSFGEE